MVMSFFLFDMFVGVMVDTFHECQQKQKRQDEAEAGGQPLEDKPRWVEMLVEGSFCVFTIILVIEILLKLTAFGIRRCTASFWNVLDIAVALISIVSIFLENALRECHPGDTRCLSYLSWASPIFFITFVMMAQFVLSTLGGGHHAGTGGQLQ
ncbi:hypothetical protein INR49_031085, partial [Caranx melampygus]